MGKVIEFPNPNLDMGKMPASDFLAYLTGETLLIAAEMQGRELRDSDGNLIRPGELYEVTTDGVKRVA